MVEGELGGGREDAAEAARGQQLDAVDGEDPRAVEERRDQAADVDAYVGPYLPGPSLLSLADAHEMRVAQ